KHTAHARGGSWWCSKNACCFFNSADIGSVDIHASFSNQGFRVVAGSAGLLTRVADEDVRAPTGRTP
ncbi:MAG TPA: hypothetical protein VKT78_14640, partial [Fimbriimonadaceae bacterium]|nr:hypothetical protein [Fimbriimonadaceae bacterium]